MALPEIEVRVSADTRQAEAGLGRVNERLGQVAGSAPTAQRAATGFGGSLRNLGNVSNQTRGRIQQVSFQLQDIAVQMQAGTRTSTVMAQQLPQLAGAFGAVGAVIGTLAAVGIPAVAYAMQQTTRRTQDFQQALEALEAVQGRVERATRILHMSTSELGAEYGRFSQRIRELALEELRLAQARAETLFAASVTEGSLQTLTNRIVRNIRVVQELGDTGTNEMYDMSRAAREVTRQFGLSGHAAVEMAGAFQSLGRANTLPEQRRALARISELLVANNIELGRIPEPLQEALAQMNALETATINVGVALSRAGDEAAGLANAIFPVFATGAGAGRGSFGMPERPVAGAGSDMGFPAAPTGGGGGGGGSAFGGRIAALVESLQTERETLEVWYEESLALLGQANEAELEAIGGHNEARLRLEEEYQSRLAAIRGAGHGDALTSVLQSGQRIATAIGQTNERAMRVAQAFGAAEALVNAYRAASQVLASPEVPWFAKVSAAAGVLAAGIGFANSIKSISAGGGGGGAAGGGAVSGGAAQSPQVSRNVAIQLTGGNMFSRDQVINLINGINEAVEDGAIVRVV